MGILVQSMLFTTLFMYTMKEASAFCIINRGCRDGINAEIWNKRTNDFFNVGFNTTARKGGAPECCDAKNSGCNYPNQKDSDEVLLWLNCGNGGQTVVACRTCDVIVNDIDMIMVMDAGETSSPRSIYACRPSGTANSGDTGKIDEEL